MSFKAVRTVVALEPADIVRLQEILMDADDKDALAFLQDVIGERVHCAQDDAHRPEFEGGIRPERAHYREKGDGHPASSESG